jgi:hypothetical protein
MGNFSSAVTVNNLKSFSNSLRFEKPPTSLGPRLKKLAVVDLYIQYKLCQLANRVEVNLNNAIAYLVF